MNGRSTRERRIRHRAWALLAALLPAVECLADGTIPVSIDKPGGMQIAPSPAGAEGGASTSSSRPAIPLPRQFTAEEMKTRMRSQVKIALPRTRSVFLALPPEAEAPAVAAQPTPDLAAQPTPAPSPAPAVAAEPAPAPAPAVAAEPAPAPARAVPAELEQALRTLAEAPPPMPAPESAPEPTPEPAPAQDDAVAQAPTPLTMPGPPPPLPSPAAVPPPAPDPSTDVPLPPFAEAGGAAGRDAMQAATPSAPARSPSQDDDVARTACTTCGGFHRGLDGPAFHTSFGCADGNCVPGRQPCNLPCPKCDTVIGAFLMNMYQNLCCPDPCYQPVWVPAANASFFADYARPRTVTRIRYDNLNDMVRPDRNQFFFKQIRTSTKGFRIGNGYFLTDPSVRLQQAYLYQEAAGARGSFFVEVPYRQVNPLFSPTSAGFSDINFGIKSLMMDTEMLQVSFQFRTYTPSGNFNKALGTGHFSLDPSLMASLKLGPETYFQSQVGQWIPLGGTSPIAGGVLYWFNSLNQVLFYCTPDSPVIATLEMDGWSFEDGGWTKPQANTKAPKIHGVPPTIATSGGGVSYFNIGPGLRWSICNKVDFGGALTWSTTAAHWADPWFRFEVRFLF